MALVSDDDLVSACRGGDPAAWAEVVDRYGRLVRSIPRAYGLDDHDSAEIAQVTFTVLLNSLDRLTTGTRLAPWLSTVARRHTWRMLESRRRETTGAVDEAQLVHDDQRRHEQQQADAEWVRAGLRQLGSKCRALLEALYLRPESSYGDVAKELDIPIGSIGPTRARCLTQLRSLLEHSAPEHSAPEHTGSIDDTAPTSDPEVNHAS